MIYDFCAFGPCTTTTTAAPSSPSSHLGLPGAGSFVPLVLLFGLVVLVIAVLISMKPSERIPRTLGGKVCGISGRMGSGKTYMAVVIAYQHILAGHDVRTNFTLKLPRHFYQPRISTTGVFTEEARRVIDHNEDDEAVADDGYRIGMWWDCFPRVSIPWEYFTGWDQFALLRYCVVIIDEAQLYAPSYKPLAFPLIARWKLAMARKFRLDVYWLSQHEDRVNSTLKHLTNIIYVCNAWFGGKWFSAKGYEPEYVRRKGKHLARRSYRFKLATAQLYDTLEILTPDAHLGDEKQSSKLEDINALADGYNKRRLSSKRGQSVDEVIDMAASVGLDVTQEKPAKARFKLPV